MAPPTGHGTVGPKHNGWMAQFLRKEAEQQSALLEGLRTRLIAALGKQADPAALPDKDWCRVARLYQDGYRMLANLELEAAKLRLLADPHGTQQPMSDDEFNAKLAELGRQAVQGLSDEELTAELQRRRAQLAPGKERR